MVLRTIAAGLLRVFFLGSVVGVACCQAQDSPELNAAGRAAVVDSLDAALRRYYVFPDTAARMAAHLRHRLAGGAYDSLHTTAGFTDAVMRDIRSISADQHLSFRYDPPLEKRIAEFIAHPQPDITDVRKEREENFFYRKVEIFPGNIGYMKFTGFADTSQQARKTVQAAMRFVAYSGALILDLRENRGGRAPMAGEILSCFFDRPTLAGRTYNRLDDSWSDEWIVNDSAVTSGLTLGMPVYVLVGSETFSAAEGLAYALQHLRNALVVGDTTAGGAHRTRSFMLGNGFVAFIPFTRSENSITKTDWEGTGVLPDIPADAGSAIQKAREHAITQLLQGATDENEQKKLRWLLNDLKAGAPDIAVPDSLLERYTGDFEEFSFRLEGRHLVCINTHRTGKIDRLVPISETLYKIDDASQVEFITDSDLRCSSIRLLWSDGWVDTISRTK